MKRLLWLALASCTTRGTLVVRADADAPARATADVLQVTAFSDTGPIFEKRLLRTRADLMWPVEIPIEAEATPVTVTLVLVPHPLAGNATITVSLRTEIPAGRTVQVDADLSRDATFDLVNALLPPFVPVSRPPDSGCAIPESFLDWGYFSNLDHSAGCVAFVDKVGCDLEVIEDCTDSPPRAAWRGGIRLEDSGSMFLFSDATGVGCDGRIDAEEPWRARFACLPRHLGLTFTRIDHALPLATVSARASVARSTFEVETHRGESRIYTLDPDEIVVYDRDLVPLRRMPVGADASMLLTPAVLYTVESGLLIQRSSETLDILRFADIGNVGEIAETRSGALLVIVADSVELVDPGSFSVLLGPHPVGAGYSVPSFLAEVDDQFYFFNALPNPELRVHDSNLRFFEAIPLPIDPVAFAPVGQRAAFVAPCLERDSAYCYFEIELSTRTIVGSAPLELSGFDSLGLLLFDDETVLLYGAPDIQPIDRVRFESRAANKIVLKAGDLAALDAQLVALVGGELVRLEVVPR